MDRWHFRLLEVSIDDDSSAAVADEDAVAELSEVTRDDSSAVVADDGAVAELSEVAGASVASADDDAVAAEHSAVVELVAGADGAGAT